MDEQFENVNDFDNKKAEEVLKKGYKKAEKLLEDEDKVERFLQRLEKKLKKFQLQGKS